MRQWHVNPKFLCRKHLLGEHVEHHMFIGSLKKGRSIDGFIRDGLVEVDTLISRHDELVEEMKRRGYNHKSPLPDESSSLVYVAGKVDRERSRKDLISRCVECEKRFSDD